MPIGGINPNRTEQPDNHSDNKLKYIWNIELLRIVDWRSNSTFNLQLSIRLQIWWKSAKSLSLQAIILFWCIKATYNNLVLVYLKGLGVRLQISCAEIPYNRLGSVSKASRSHTEGSRVAKCLQNSIAMTNGFA